MRILLKITRIFPNPYWNFKEAEHSSSRSYKSKDEIIKLSWDVTGYVKDHSNSGALLF